MDKVAAANAKKMPWRLIVNGDMAGKSSRVLFDFWLLLDNCMFVGGGGRVRRRSCYISRQLPAHFRLSALNQV
jgi:hypothetical protein